MLIKQVKVKRIKHQQQNKQTNKNENNQCTAHDYQHLTAKIWNQFFYPIIDLEHVFGFD